MTSLADSRFDWERVMRELALVIPGDVWLTNLTGTVRPGVQVDGGANISALREGAPGPALELIGCASGQDAVARFITDLKDIDGVTRVGVLSSQLPTGSSSGSGGSASSGASSDSNASSASGTCQTRKFIAQFQIVATFDAAPIPAGQPATRHPTTAPPRRRLRPTRPAPRPRPRPTTTTPGG